MVKPVGSSPIKPVVTTPTTTPTTTPAEKTPAPEHSFSTAAPTTHAVPDTRRRGATRSLGNTARTGSLAQPRVRATSTATTQAPQTRLNLSGSVGRGGKNRPEDVRQVQQALQERGYLTGDVTPGKIDEKTMRAIEKYQDKNELPVVDGRIDVRKSTMKHINNSVGQPTPATPTPATPATPTTPSVTPPTPGTTPVAPSTPLRPTGPLDSQLQQLGAHGLQAGLEEWQNGVRERGSTNRGERVDQYARNAKMRPGGEWCGYFTGHALSQAGFKHPESLASYQKARDYFMYRNYTSKTGSDKNDRLDDLRAQHQANGDGRQYFMLPESPTQRRVTRPGTWGNRRYGHVDADANTFTHDRLPIRAGDVALFTHGHVGMVDSYDPATGLLTTVEGNTTGRGPDGRRRSGAVVRKTYDLTDPRVRAKFDGFGRPARADFE